MRATHVIVGSGSVGTATALELAERGHEVTVVTRSGSGPEHPGIRRIAADAADPEALTALSRGASALYNCANPPYHRWPELWPPLAASLLSAAERSGAVLVTMSNLYGYGPVDHPMTERDPLAATGCKGRVRAGMWAGTLAASGAGLVRMTEARASDFFGPGVVGTSHFGRNMERLLAGRPVSVLGDPDALHSWTFVPDVGRTLAVLGTDNRAWGRAWHVPTGPPTSQREMAGRFCALARLPAPTMRSIPWAVVSTAGLFSSEMRELKETRYQFDRGFVLDSSAFTRTFGMEPTPLDQALSTTLDTARAPQAAPAR
jgi:nucleoside-diphosphate-sugar epimerase